MSNEIKVKIESTSPVADPVNLKTVKYDNLTGKPKINGVELVGDKSTADLGIEVDTSKFATKDELNGKADKSEIPDVSGYLPTTGGTLTGEALFDGGSDTYNGTFAGICAAGIQSAGITDVYKNYGVLTYGDRVVAAWSGSSFDSRVGPGTGSTLGNVNTLWKNVYAKALNGGKYGADIAIPTEGGTLARIEDIDAAVGDISTALTAILGE